MSDVRKVLVYNFIIGGVLVELDFYPILTQDNSIGLFSKVVDDIYHSSYGAYTEAVQKFIEPCGVLKELKSKSVIRVLDICFGMGYNSRALIEKILQTDFQGEIIIDALEIDSNVVAFSLLVKNPDSDFDFLEYIEFSSENYEKILNSIFSIIENPKFKDFLDEQKGDFFKSIQKYPYKYKQGDEISGSLHNIYYEYVSSRNIKNEQLAKIRPKIRIVVHLGDAREQLCKLEGKYDHVFLDAFTPIKLPTLWSVEFFKQLLVLISDGGNIVTYSNSAAVRGGMIEAGLFVGKTQYGTIAYKNFNSALVPLDAKSLGLIKTKAGVPFYDFNLTSSKDEILINRDAIIKASNRQSSSQFLKYFQIKK